MPGKHNAGGCGCCCSFCTDLYARSWVFSLCGFTSAHALAALIESAFDNLSFSFPSSAVTYAYIGSGNLSVVGACATPSWTTQTYTLEEYDGATGNPLGTYEDIEFSSPSLVINFIQTSNECDPVFHWFLNFSTKISGGSVSTNTGIIGNTLPTGFTHNPHIDGTHCMLPYQCPSLVYEPSNVLVNCTHDLSTSGALTGATPRYVSLEASLSDCESVRIFENPLYDSTCTLHYSSAPSGDTASAISCI